jgi:hypothetical protein
MEPKTRKKSTLLTKRTEMEVKLKVLKVTVVLDRQATDTIILSLDMPTPFPEMKYAGTMKLEARQGYGVQWCQEVLGLRSEDIEVISIPTRLLE